MPLSRPQLLAALAVLAVVVNIAWYYLGNWGRVTIHAYQQPLAAVAASIARQGHIRLRTNLDPQTKVTLDFDKVPVADAVDRLAIVTEGRWRVAYLVGPDARAFQPLLDGWAAGNADPAWRWIERPLPVGMLGALGNPDDAEVAADPRAGKIAFTNAGSPPPPPRPAPDAAPDPGAPAPPPPAPAPVLADAPPAPLTQLQPLLEKAALFADVRVAVPTDWNPPVPSFSAKADAPGLFARLAKAGHSRTEEVFLLSGRRERRGPRPETADGDAPPPNPNRMNPAAINEALQGYIDRLPPEQRPQAQAALDDRRRQWKEMQGLTPEQRRARFLAMLSDPAMQEQMEDRQADREAKMTPEQKTARASRTVAAKQSAIGK